jgi:cytochrome c-type protein NapC
MLRRLKLLLVDVWRIASRPSGYLPLGALVLGGFVFGVVFWGGFNTALEATNTEEFCISCHEMQDNVYQELQQTVHFTNRTGVRATCPDCHVPHDWTDKIARKMQASKEVWGHIFGTLATKQDFEEHRLEMAKHEWSRLKANNSQECKNCHKPKNMDLVAQNARAQRIHQEYLFNGDKTCIDCHKGIAHELPDMSNVEPGWKVAPELRGSSGL